MPHTLRRKMFKLGGEVNSHGVGLTSGLNYNRPGYNGGGTVAPVGSDVYPKVMGPDGKMREAHGAGMLSFLAPGILSLLRLGPRIKKGGWDAVKKYFSPRPSKMSGRKDYRGPSGERVSETVRRTGAGGKPYDLISKTVGTPGARTANWWQHAKMAPRYLGAGVGGLGALGAVSSLAPRGDPETALGSTFEGLRGLSEGAFNIMGYLPAGLIQSPFRSFGDMESASNLIRNKIYGDEKSKVEVKGPVAEGIETQEEEFAALKEDAEKRAKLYMDLLGEEPDKMGAISRGLIQAGQLWDDDRAAAIGAMGTEAGAETQRVRDLENQFKGMAVQEVVGGDLAQQQALDQAKVNLISDPQLDPSMRSQGLKGIEAYEEGVTDILPLNAKQDAADGSRLSEGSVYYDPTNLYGGMYVGVSSNPDDPDGQVQGFDSAEEAKAHAAG